MDIVLPLGGEKKTLSVNLPQDTVVVTQSKNPSTTKSWGEVVGEAIRSPIGTQPIHRQNLRGKKVTIITDDWGRPTPAYEVLPVILRELETTGVATSQKRITGSVSAGFSSTNRTGTKADTSSSFPAYRGSIPLRGITRSTSPPNLSPVWQRIRAGWRRMKWGKSSASNSSSTSS